MRPIKIILFDRVNRLPLVEFSNPPLGAKFSVNLEENLLTFGTENMRISSMPISPGDVFEIRVEAMEPRVEPPFKRR